MNLRLKDTLKQRLFECGWKDAVKHECIRVIKDRGIESITLEEIQDQVIPFARGTVDSKLK